MDYIEALRQKIGHDLILTLGAGALIEDRDGRLLLQRRPDSGLFGIPGGLVEPGESVLEAVVREVREETGIAFAPQQAAFFGIYSGPQGFADYPSGDRVFSVQLVFRVRTWDAPAALPPGHEFRGLWDFPDEELWHRHQSRILDDWSRMRPGPFLR